MPARKALARRPQRKGFGDLLRRNASRLPDYVKLCRRPRKNSESLPRNDLTAGSKVAVKSSLELLVDFRLGVFAILSP